MVEKYGEFDSYVEKASDYQATYYIGYYLIKPEHVGYLGTTPEEFFCVEFNSEGVAYDCYEKQAGADGGA